MRSNQRRNSSLYNKETWQNSFIGIATERRICVYTQVLLYSSLQVWIKLSSYRVMKTRRSTRRPLISSSITSGPRMRTAALRPRLTLASSSTSSSSVRLLWKVSSFEAILCFHVPVSDQATQSSPLVEPTVLMELTSQMFSIILFALICLPCAPALSHTSGKPLALCGGIPC